MLYDFDGNNMDDGLIVKKGVVIEILEEEGEWSWCCHGNKVIFRAHLVTFRRVMFLRLF